MTDKLSKKQRSANMRAVRGKNTKPELLVRHLVHAMGFRYRLHGRDLVGKPDLVFASKRSVIFVHGCFWHRHERCSRATIPQTNADFWKQKLAGNAKRDAGQVRILRKAGWKVLVIWECESRNERTLKAKLKRFLV